MLHEQMFPTNTTLITNTTAGEMARVYANNVNKVIEGLRQVTEAVAAMRKVFFGSLGSTLFEFKGSRYTDSELEELLRSFKRQAWNALITKLELRRVMSSSAQAKLDLTFHPERDSGRELIDEFPEITEENIVAVMQGYMSCTSEFFDEAVREEGRYWLPTHTTYVANKDRWKVSEKIIMTHVMSKWDALSSSHSVQYGKARHVTNLDNIFHMLDGKGFAPGHSGPLHHALHGNKSGFGETEYFRFRCYRNGNLHLWIKDEALLAKFNEVGCGEGTGLPDMTRKRPELDPLEDGVPETEFKDMNFFPTPTAIVNRMVEIVKAELACDSLWGLTALEPSAGDGRLIYGLLREDCRKVHAFEYDITRAKVLEREMTRGYNSVSVLQADFLQVTPFPTMDVILTNPPFSGGRDMRHVHHAVKFLSTKGVLVSVMSPHWQFASDKLSVSFRDWLQKLQHKWIPLPKNSFKQSKTGVNTGLLVLRRQVQDFVPRGSITTGSSTSVRSSLACVGAA
jgi:predicted RNA methylase